MPKYKIAEELAYEPDYNMVVNNGVYEPPELEYSEIPE